MSDEIHFCAKWSVVNRFGKVMSLVPIVIAEPQSTTALMFLIKIFVQLRQFWGSQ